MGLATLACIAIAGYGVWSGNPDAIFIATLTFAYCAIFSAFGFAWLRA